MKFECTLPPNIKKDEAIVLPISMNQPLERGKRLESILYACESYGYKNQITILICDYLNRHNCIDTIESLKLGDIFIDEHKEMLNGYRIVRWKEFLDSINKNFLEEKLHEITTKSTFGSRFYNKMKKTWDKCLSANQSLDNSIIYQVEEYAAILCMKEFEHLFYPKRITNGMAYLYNFIEGKKPTYHHIKISENKQSSINENIPNENFFIGSTNSIKENRNHLHVAFRALLEQTDILLSSPELSSKSKKIFAEEAENLFMKHNLLSEQYDENI